MYFIVFADLNYTFIQFQHCTMVSSTNGSTEVKKPFQRLPTGVVPSHYEIFLKPNLSDLNFIGNINVELDVVQQTSEFTFSLQYYGKLGEDKMYLTMSHCVISFVRSFHSYLQDAKKVRKRIFKYLSLQISGYS